MKEGASEQSTQFPGRNIRLQKKSGKMTTTT